ncbi:MAG: type II toxin-antitoxin system CcdA family antitoxin [Candidatus Dechloromonas phosphoritropha]
MLPTPPRRAVNLTVNSALVQEAKQFDINLSREFEAHLADLVKRRKQEMWLAENREAIDAYNAHIERDGVFSDGLRGF